MIKQRLLEDLIATERVEEYKYEQSVFDAEPGEEPELFALEDLASVWKPGEVRETYCYGAIIAEDCTVYVLLRSMYHGVVSALLYPELAQQFGYAVPPPRNCSVIQYQRFQFLCTHVTSDVLIGAGNLGAPSVSYNCDARPTKKQAFQAVQYLNELGHSGKDSVFTAHGEIQINDLETYLLRDKP